MSESTSAKKRRAKQRRNAFLLHFEKYLTPPTLALPANQFNSFTTALGDLCTGTRQSVINYISAGFLFQEWCRYIGAETDPFPLFAKHIGASWFHSKESLQFVCNELLRPILKACCADVMYCVDVASGLTEACMQAYGIPILCESALHLQSSPTCINNNAEGEKKDATTTITPLVFIERYKNVPLHVKNQNHVLYVDLRLGLRFEAIQKFLDSDNEIHFIVMAGPMCILPFLYRSNELLIERYKFQRRIYELGGVSADRVVFDSELRCTCAVVYYRHQDVNFLPLTPQLENSINPLRHHNIRHALAGNIPEYWKYVLPAIPFKTFLKHLGTRSSCPFDDMLIDVISTSSSQLDTSLTVYQKDEGEDAFDSSFFEKYINEDGLTLASKSCFVHDTFDHVIARSGLRTT